MEPIEKEQFVRLMKEQDHMYDMTVNQVKELLTDPSNIIKVIVDIKWFNTMALLSLDNKYTRYNRKIYFNVDDVKIGWKFRQDLSKIELESSTKYILRFFINSIYDRDEVGIMMVGIYYVSKNTTKLTRGEISLRNRYNKVIKETFKTFPTNFKDFYSEINEEYDHDYKTMIKMCINPFSLHKRVI